MSENTQKSCSGSTKEDASEFHILPIDEDKKYPPQQPKLPGVESYINPFMMPGPFVSSMGGDATIFEREHGSKAKKEQ